MTVVKKAMVTLRSAWWSKITTWSIPLWMANLTKWVGLPPLCVANYSEVRQRFFRHFLSASSLTHLPTEHLGLIPPQNVSEDEVYVSDFMRPAPHPNPEEFGLEEDDIVADPLSDQFWNLWNGTARRNREVFSDIFKTMPTNLVRNWTAYEVSWNFRDMVRTRKMLTNNNNNNKTL